jgi:hypothetical protein
VADQRDRKRPAAKKAPAKKSSIQDAQEKARAATKKREDAARKNAESVKRAQAASGQGEVKPQDESAKYEARARSEGWDTPESISAAVKKYREEDAKKLEGQQRAGMSMLGAADQVTGNIKDLAAKQPARALADPSSYGVTGAARMKAARAASEARRLQLLTKQGKALIYLGPVVAKKAKQRYGKPGEFAQTQSEQNQAAGQEIGDNIADSDSLSGWLYNDKYRNMIVNQAHKTGLDVDPNNFDELEKLWTTVLKRSAIAFSAGQKVTPWAVMGLMAKQGFGQPTSRTTNQSSTDIEALDPAQARLMIEKAASEALGRRPTESEIDSFAAKAQQIAQSNPRVTNTTTTTQYDAEGNALASNSKSNASGGAEVVNAQSQVAAEDQARANPEYDKVQKGMTYFPMFFDALSSPV